MMRSMIINTTRHISISFRNEKKLYKVYTKQGYADSVDSFPFSVDSSLLSELFSVDSSLLSASDDSVSALAFFVGVVSSSLSSADRFSATLDSVVSVFAFSFVFTSLSSVFSASFSAAGTSPSASAFLAFTSSTVLATIGSVVVVSGVSATTSSFVPGMLSSYRDEYHIRIGKQRL